MTRGGMAADRLPLADALRVTAIDTDVFLGQHVHPDAPRLFGGELLGQAIYAAGCTVPADAGPHSLHAYFMRAGDPSQPIAYAVDRVRDGRAYSLREVRGSQGGREIFRMTTSFHVPEQTEWSRAVSMPVAGDPDSLPPMREAMEPYRDELSEFFRRVQPVELRYPGLAPWEARREGLRSDVSQTWMRCEPLGSPDPLLRFAALAYASDMSLLDPVVMSLGLSWDPTMLRTLSLDHAMWFHATPVVDDWMLYDQQAPWAGDGRGIARGLIFQRDGRLIATVTQEGSLRRP